MLVHGGERFSTMGGETELGMIVGSSLSRPEHCSPVEASNALLFIFKEQLETRVDDGECEIVPRQRVFWENFYFTTFFARTVSVALKLGSEQDVALADVGEIENGVEAEDVNFGESFFPGFSSGSCLNIFVEFKKTRRNGPQPVLGLDRSFTEEESPLSLNDAARDNPRVFIMDAIALGADLPISPITIWLTKNRWASAGEAVANLFQGGHVR